MLVGLYVGDHHADGLAVRAGWWLTRRLQKGDYARVTHCEAILARRGDGTAVIASSSLRDGGVRIKHGVPLNPAAWLIVDVPAWSAASAAQWFAAHAGEPYDWRGALATLLPGHHRSGAWFCNEAVGAAAGVQTPEQFTPALFAALCLTFGDDVTAEFFKEFK